MSHREKYEDPHRAVLLSGSEPFEGSSREVSPTVLDLWRWSASDLPSNTTRGVLAEFMVASALGVADGVRSEWDAYDVLSPGEMSVEVKSAAYVQAWAQKGPSPILFRVARTKAWDPDTGRSESEVGVRGSSPTRFRG